DVPPRCSPRSGDEPGATLENGSTNECSPRSGDEPTGAPGDVVLQGCSPRSGDEPIHALVTAVADVVDGEPRLGVRDPARLSGTHHGEGQSGVVGAAPPGLDRLRPPLGGADGIAGGEADRADRAMGDPGPRGRDLARVPQVHLVAAGRDVAQRAMLPELVEQRPPPGFVRHAELVLAA